MYIHIFRSSVWLSLTELPSLDVFLADLGASVAVTLLAVQCHGSHDACPFLTLALVCRLSSLSTLFPLARTLSSL